MIEVYRPSEGHALLWREGSNIVAVASDAPLPAVTVPVLDLNDAQAIVTFALAKAETYDHAAP
jgi:molybdopterin-guanine dinucleotide biosynthesis protein B